jgi:hypothetical protein
MTDAWVSRLAVVRPKSWALVASFYSDLAPDVRMFPMGTTPVIYGTIFEDADADFFNETGLTPRAGAGVFLDRNENSLVDEGEESVVSNAQGEYRFDDDILPGQVQVRAVPTQGWTQEQPISRVGAFVGAAQDSAVFTYRSNTITGTIFKDMDRDGVRDEGEGGFDNVFISAAWDKTYGDGSRIVVLPDNPGNAYPKEIESATDQDGNFTLRDVPIFSDQIVIPIYDWYLTTSADDEANELVIGLAHPSNLSSDPKGTVRGIVFNDLNHNGAMDAGEPPIVGVQVQPGVNSWPNSYPSAITDSNGFYELQLFRGRYRLHVMGVNGNSNTAMPEFSIFEGETENINLSVGYYARVTGRILVSGVYGPPPQGQVLSYLDYNNNFKRDADEPSILGAVGWDYQIITTIPGDYTVRLEQIPNHLRLISELPTGTAVMGNLNEHEPIYLDAPVYEGTPTFFFDRNGNGRRDRGEPLLKDVGVAIDSNDNGKQDRDELTYYTDKNGQFSAVIPYGTSRLILTVPDRYRHMGIFSRDVVIAVFSSMDAEGLLIGLRGKK